MADPSRGKKVEILKADRSLQTKAGTGSIEADKVNKAQKSIESNTVDFVPIAGELLDRLAMAVKDARENPGKDTDILMENFKVPIMGMKANAAMFGYPLVTDMTGSMLDFLEAYESIDSDIIKIVDAHYKTLQLIIARKMNGDGGKYGSEFRKELENVCERYLSKNSKRKTEN